MFRVTELGKTRNHNFGSVRSFLRGGNQTKWIKLGVRVLIADVTKNPKVILAELQRSCVQMVESSRRSAIAAALHRSELCESVQTEACPQRKTPESPPGPMWAAVEGDSEAGSLLTV